MAGKKLKIVSIASEMTPFSKSGGLADVAECLPRAIRGLGQEVIAITPLYEQIIDKDKWGLKRIFEDVEVYLNDEESVTVNYWQGSLPDGLVVYFIENGKYFSRKKNMYGSEHENARFFIFDVAALKLLSLLKFEADIIHCHDWHTGLIPYFLKTDFRYSETLKASKTIFTIHNLVFQLGRDWWSIPPEARDDGRGKLPKLSEPSIENVNFVRRAILHADALTTVSETYREEIMTKEFGEDQEKLLANRADRLFGIVNGIDEGAWDPATDPGLFRNYDSERFIQSKAENKAFVQKSFGLSISPTTPIICSACRMTFQKGFELIVNIMEHLAALDLQVIMVGDCHKDYLSKLKKFARKHPKKIVFLPTHDDCMKYETQIYAASDLYLMPSYYEPCGLNQLRAMRYGSVPVVRKVGGLSDTVDDYDASLNRGTGFVFEKFNEFQLFGAIVRATESYKDKAKWGDLVQRAMESSHSWDIPANKYLKLYRAVRRWDKGRGPEGAETKI
jgi:starch synthase